MIKREHSCWGGQFRRHTWLWARLSCLSFVNPYNQPLFTVTTLKRMLLDPLAVTQMLKGSFKIQMSHLVPIKIKLFDGIKTIESTVHEEPGGKKGIDPTHVRNCIHLWTVLQIVTYLRLFLFSLSTLTLLSPSKVRPGISTSRFLFSSSRRKLSKWMNTWEGHQL